MGKALVSFGVSIAGTLKGSKSGGSGWSAEKQAAFSSYMGQVVNPDGNAESCEGGSCDGCVPVCTDQYFSGPPGVGELDGERFGGVAVSDLIRGSLRTYIQNGKQNGGKPTDPTDSGSLDELMDQDITTPGFVRIPVCSTDIAFAAWDDVSDTSVPNWPCYIKPAKNDCEASSYEDQTSDASPSVDDCMQIVKNIQGTSGEWEVENAIGGQHQLVQSGGCAFGIQGLNKHGNIQYFVGAQDIVDLITESVKQFGGGGKVGAKGKMSCRGNVNSQDVK